MTESADYNISKNFFSNYHQIKDEQNRPLTNVYWSHALQGHDHGGGCLYLIHGYGGSPVEPCLKMPMQYALRNGFDVVALEGVDLSATAGQVKEINSMTLERQKKALDAGIQFCRDMPDLNQRYNIAWVHSISCRALSDLMIDSVAVRNYFAEAVLNNPYFLPPPKVKIMRDRYYLKDPSGKTWDAIAHRVTHQMRVIEHQTFQIPTCIYNFAIPLPPVWTVKPQFEDLARRVSFFVKRLYLHFILGTNDDKADYQQNLNIYRGLDIPHKQLVSIQGANHSFENAQVQYMEFAHVILDSIRERIVKTK